jgi:ProP effector
MKACVQKDHEIIASLAESFPQAFFVLGKLRRPLKIGIRDDLRPLVSFSEDNLKSALHRYTRADAYLRACTVEGTQRIGLDGNAAGEVTARDAAHAERVLAEREIWHAEKKAKRERLRLKEAARKAKNVTHKPSPTPTRLTLSDLKSAAVKRRASAA